MAYSALLRRTLRCFHIMKYLHFDLRALGLMRILVAAIVLTDLMIRAGDLEAFYSNTGVLPLTLLFENLWNPYYISIHTISGLWQVQLILFILSSLCAFMLLIGYRTTLFTGLCWFLMLSLHNRNSLILQGGDDLLRMILFWSMFIPWGERYSCDRLLDPVKYEHAPIISVALIAYLLQVSYIYTGSALLKGPEWNTDFTALYYAYSIDQITHPSAKLMFYYPKVLKTLTCLAYYFELFIPVLFFIPYKHGAFRTIAVILIIFFHLINNFTLFIGLFPFIGIATSTGILPSNVMDKFDRITHRLKRFVSGFYLTMGSIISKMITWRKPEYVHKPVYMYVKTAILIFLTVYVFDWNFSNISFVNKKLSDHLRFIGYTLRLDQNWGMFAPGVFKQDGWYILEATDGQKKHFNLLEPKKNLTYQKPVSVVSMFKNDRWRKYSENLIFQENEVARGYFCSYCTRFWNERHPENQINSLQIIYMEEMTLPDYRYALPQKTILWQCDL
jgi:hypothetical protein